MRQAIEMIHRQAEVNAAPDWSVVPFAVTCARCGHDLHGRSEPTCPGCALTFRWADAVPIEQLTCASCGYHLYGLKEPRCPECATEFTWEAALANYHRERKPLFEYQWRKQPVRSLFRTWWLALRPKKLWTTVEIHDPVRVWPLVTSSCVIAFFLLAVIVPTAILARAAMLTYYLLKDSPYWKVQGMTFAESFMDNSRWLFEGVQSQYGVVTIGYFVIWLLSLLAGLLIFQQSMTRYKVRMVHVWRVATYAVAMGWLGITLGIMVNTVLYHCFPQWYELCLVGGTIVVIAFVYSIRSVAIGYRFYLRMDHPWSVSASAHVIAIMLTFILAIPLLPGNAGLTMLQSVMETIGLV